MSVLVRGAQAKLSAELAGPARPAKETAAV
jgi:hypothetical protein